MVKWFADNIGLGIAQHAPIGEQFGRLWRLMLMNVGIALTGIAGVLVLSARSHRPMSYMTRDPAATTDAEFYLGFLSNLGIMLWSAAAAVCLFTAVVLHRRRAQRQSLFLLVSGLFSLVLVLDDAFMLHEEVLPGRLHVPQLAVYAGYAILISGYLVFFARDILRTDYLLLATALSFLGLSMGMDEFLPFNDLETMIEDGMKFSGIVFWTSYHVHAASGMIESGTARA